MSQTEDIDRDIEELDRALQQLELVQRRVEAVRSRLRRREQQRPKQSNQQRTSHVPVREVEVVTNHIRNERVHTRNETNPNDAVLPNSDLFIGDTVRIDNPRDFQQDTGTVVGSQGRFVEVRTQNRNIVRRIPKNLTLLSRGTNPQEYN